jgi:hypothetical protein
VQPYVDAAVALAVAPGFEVGAVTAVRLVAEDKERDWFEPAEARRSPTNASAAANSVAFGVACGLAHHGLHVADLVGVGDGPLGGSEVARLLACTDHRFGGDAPAVEVIFGDASTQVMKCAVRGADLSDEALLAKVVEANRLATQPRSDAAIATLVEALADLGERSDVRGLFA